MYRLSRKEMEEVERQVAELLRKGLIQPSSSPYGAPILFVAKKDGTLRMCIDYRALNKITINNKYPLPRIDDLIDCLQGAKVFSSLDLQSGYHQIRITPEDVPKTAFNTPLGHYEFKVLSFGLTNAPASFQSIMNDIFRPHLRKCCLVYLDDILVLGKDAESHAQHLDAVLSVLEQHQFYAKMSKCTFEKHELAFLGFIVSSEGIKVDPKKTDVVARWPVPLSINHLRSFLGLSNYFRKFVQGYSTLVAPLTELTKEDKPWAWTPACQQAFDGVKAALTNPPVLAMPRYDQPFEVICDASGVGIGAVLLQEGRPVAFESRKLSPAEQNYHTTERELLAVVHAMRTWRCYLEGVPKDMLTVVTDHNPLTYFATQPTLSRRQARWSKELSMFTFRWEYRPGRVNVADPLSRHPEFAAPMRLALSAIVTRSRSGAHAGREVSVAMPKHAKPVVHKRRPKPKRHGRVVPTAELDVVPPESEWHSWGPLRRPRSARAVKVNARWSREVANMRRALTLPVVPTSLVQSNMPEAEVARTPVRARAGGDQPIVASPPATLPMLVAPQAPIVQVAEVGRPVVEQAEAR
jgi:hypothetical protein